MNDPLSDYTTDERLLFGGLARTSQLNPGAEQAIVDQLRREGFLREPGRKWPRLVAAALAAGLIAVAWLAGVRHGADVAQRATIEGMLKRADLSRDERVLLMQRAGSAYVEAANAYASNVARTDSTAMEVSSQVLIGAAQAVARTNLDGGMAPRLAAMIRDSRATRNTPLTSIIWY